MENRGKSIFDYYLESINNRRLKYTDKRKSLIKDVLTRISENEAKTIIEYIFNSDDEYASYMRGNNYCSFENIFRITKLKDKLDKSKLWKDSMNLPEDFYGWEIK